MVTQRPNVDFATRFQTPRVVGPPPPMGDTWTFESMSVNPVDGSISALQLVTLIQPNDTNGNPVEPKRIATFTVAFTAKDARTALGDTEYEALMTKISTDLHILAKIQGTEPV